MKLKHVSDQFVECGPNVASSYLFSFILKKICVALESPTLISGPLFKKKYCFKRRTNKVICHVNVRHLFAYLQKLLLVSCFCSSRIYTEQCNSWSQKILKNKGAPVPNPPYPTIYFRSKLWIQFFFQYTINLTELFDSSPCSMDNFVLPPSIISEHSLIHSNFEDGKDYF